MRRIIKYIKNPSRIGSGLLTRYFKWLPDELYLRLLYRFIMGTKLNLDHPTTFQEKLQWLKLYNRKNEYIKMVDKIAVKDYVANLIGPEYIIPTLGSWELFDDINFDKLPNQFVLKTTHGGGGCGVAVCTDKGTFDKATAKAILEASMNSNIYDTFREWPYKGVPKRIMAEQFVDAADNNDLRDYKFFCFNGVPRFLKVDFNRFVAHRANYYDMDWNLLEFGESNFLPDFEHTENKPENFDKMREIASKLSKGQPFLRVDLYNNNGQILFGELTFFPASGFDTFMPQKYNTIIGEYISLQ